MQVFRQGPPDDGKTASELLDRELGVRLDLLEVVAEQEQRLLDRAAPRLRRARLEELREAGPRLGGRGFLRRFDALGIVQVVTEEPNLPLHELLGPLKLDRDVARRELEYRFFHGGHGGLLSEGRWNARDSTRRRRNRPP
jgi:hypothetical protein